MLEYFFKVKIEPCNNASIPQIAQHAYMPQEIERNNGCGTCPLGWVISSRSRVGSAGLCFAPVEQLVNAVTHRIAFYPRWMNEN